jgi:hypothetical protein
VDYAQENWNVTPVRIEACSNYAGPVKIIGNTAVVQSLPYFEGQPHAGLSTLDISNLSSIQPLTGIMAPFAECCPEIVVRDNSLYMAADDVIFHYSYSDPAHPELIATSSSPTEMEYHTAFKEFNNLMYLGSYFFEMTDEWLYSAGVVTAYQVGLNGEILPLGYSASSTECEIFDCLVFNGNHGLAFAKSYNYGYLIDLGENGSVMSMEYQNFNRSFDWADIENNIMAVITRDDHLVTYDATDLSNPIEIGSVQLPAPFDNFSVYVRISNGIAYLCLDNQGLVIVDITDPTQPLLLSTTRLAEDTQNMDIVGTTLYLSTDNGLFILDVSNLQSPAVLGHYPAFKRLNRTIEKDNQLYVFSLAGFGIYEITDDSQMVFASSFQAPIDDYSSSCYEILWGNYVYLSRGGNGLIIVDVSDPTNPTQVSTLSSFVSTSLREIRDNIGYAINNRLRLYDLTNPLEPSPIGHVAPNSLINDIYVQDGYVYAAEISCYGNNNRGVEIFDTHDPAHPLSVGYCPTGSDAYDVDVCGDYAYVAVIAHKLIVLDVSDRTHPVRVSSLNFDDNIYPNAVTVDDGYAILCCGESGFYVINVQNPAEPFIAGYYNTPGYAMSAEFDYPIIRLSDGFSVTLYTCSVTPPSVPQNLIISVDGDSVDLTWSASVGATLYHIYAGSSPDTTDWTPVITSTVNSCSLSIPGGRSKFYRVTAE